ncbi:MAG: amidohydrolase [Candidatus Thorarchaeota archaeon]|nr:amidohydrolase [Candidatus Thorarchaeota archaeon]
MKIIDSHVHTWTQQIISKKDIEARRIAAEHSGTEPQLNSPVFDLRNAMKKAEVSHAVILPIDSGLNQDMPLTLQEKTDYHVDEIEGDKTLVTFVGLDPRRGKEGLIELERAVKEKGCRGWKMYPPNGFYPDQEEFYPYYNLCVELGVPVTVHQGFTSRFKYVKYARPVHVDKVAVDFPELKIILAHVGIPWVNEALMVAAKNPNVSVDVSGWQVYAKTPLKIYQMIADAKLVHVFPNRFLWGSDFPLFENDVTLHEWAEFFRNLQLPQEMIDQGYRQVSTEDIERVMWKNAARLMFGEKQ